MAASIPRRHAPAALDEPLTDAAWVVTVGVDGVVDYANAPPGWEDARSRVLGKVLLDACPPEVRNRTRLALERARSGCSDAFVGSWMSDHGERWYEARVTPLPRDGGFGATFALSDITDRHLREEEARIADRRLQTLFEQSNVGMTISDMERRYLSVNPSFARILGYRAQDIQGYQAWEFMHPEDAPADKAWLAKARAGLSLTRSAQVRFRHADGRDVWTHVSCSVVHNDDGIPQLVGIVEDITTHHLMTEALAESELRFRQLAESVSEVFWVTDPDKRTMLYISPAYERIWGRSRESLYQDPASWRDAIHPDDRHRIAEAASAQADRSYDVEYRIARPDGSERWIHDRSSRVLDAQGQCYRLVGIAEDITARKETEAQLDLQHRMLVQTEKLAAVGSLTAGVAHEINNPLAYLLGNEEINAQQLQALAARSDLDASTRDALNECWQATQANLRGLSHIKRIVQSLRALSRASDRRDNAVDLRATAEHALVLANDHAAKHRVTLQQDIPPALTRVVASPEEIAQVLLNLLLNAIDAAGDGGTVKLVARSGPDAVRFDVEDTGPGIPPHVAAKLFNPFFTTKLHGTGLGLSISQRIAHDHGGSLLFGPRPGGGTVFTLRLPPVTRPA